MASGRLQAGKIALRLTKQTWQSTCWRARATGIWFLNNELEKNPEVIRQLAALHERVALLEMVKHEFLDKNYRHERTVFADGTTVTVDWDANTYKIEPELK